MLEVRIEIRRAGAFLLMFRPEGDDGAILEACAFAERWRSLYH